ncbi:MAG: cytochrome P450 [Myxococcales bacterium]|jgi:cytochrome P450|nr:cytochrome P450 [Myxococcales bacterium]
MQDSGAFDLLSSSFLANPYPTYARLRSEAPVYFSQEWKSWLITRYDDVVACYREPRLSADRAKAFSDLLPPELRPVAEPIVRNMSSWALQMDPPTHTRLRALLNQAFTPRLMQELQPRIGEIAAELIEQLASQPEVDLVKALAEPLPIAVIGELLGLAPSEWPLLKSWSTALVTFLGTPRVTVEILQQAAHAISSMEDFFRVELQKRRAAPRQDLLSNLLQASERGTILGEQELLSTCCMVLFGGHETTTNLIGNAIRHLYAQPVEVRQSLQESAKMSVAVEEIMRFESPVQRMGRLVTEDFALHGQTLCKGQRVFLMLGSANRDSAHFADADQLVLDRRENRHLGFGFGSHYCVGAALGRMETALCLSRLFARIPSLKLIEKEPQWVPNATVRGPASLLATTHV